MSVLNGLLNFTKTDVCVTSGLWVGSVGADDSAVTENIKNVEMEVSCTHPQLLHDNLKVELLTFLNCQIAIYWKMFYFTSKQNTNITLR